MVTDVERGLRKERGHGLSFLQDLRSSHVGDSKNERTRVHARGLLLAPGENRRAGGVGNSESIAEILFAVSQSVERQEMERTMGHDDEMLAL